MGLGVLLVGIVHEAGVANIRVVLQRLLHLAKEAGALLHQGNGLFVLAPVDRANGVGAVADDGARSGEALLARGVLSVEVLPYFITDGFQLLQSTLLHWCVLLR